ncbi:MAG: hypothetical protein R3C11_24660 [Planctomycetaceae bacterium]
MNLNRLYYRNQQRLHEIVNNELFGSGSSSLSKQLLTPVTNSTRKQPMLFYSWGQVFRIPDDLAPGANCSG